MGVISYDQLARHLYNTWAHESWYLLPDKADKPVGAWEELTYTQRAIWVSVARAAVDEVPGYLA